MSIEGHVKIERRLFVKPSFLFGIFPKLKIKVLIINWGEMCQDGRKVI